MLRKIRHALGKHEWRHYGDLEATRRVCIECGEEQELKEGKWTKT